MKFNGYMLKDAIDSRKESLNILKASFKDSNSYFKSDGKPLQNPFDFESKIDNVLGELAILNVAQCTYNIRVSVDGIGMCLEELIKKYGAESLLKELWDQLFPEEPSFRKTFGFDSIRKDNSQEYSSYQIDKIESKAKAKEHSNMIRNYRKIIRIANATMEDTINYDHRLEDLLRNI